MLYCVGYTGTSQLCGGHTFSWLWLRLSPVRLKVAHAGGRVPACQQGFGSKKLCCRSCVCLLSSALTCEGVVGQRQGAQLGEADELRPCGPQLTCGNSSLCCEAVL